MLMPYHELNTRTVTEDPCVPMVAAITQAKTRKVNNTTPTESNPSTSLDMLPQVTPQVTPQTKRPQHKEPQILEMLHECTVDSYSQAETRDEQWKQLWN